MHDWFTIGVDGNCSRKLRHRAVCGFATDAHDVRVSAAAISFEVVFEVAFRLFSNNRLDLITLMALLFTG